MAGTVERIAGGLLRIAENRVIEFRGVEARALYRALGRNGAQFLGGKILKFAAIAPKRSARAADNGDVAGLECGVHGVRKVPNGTVKLVSLTVGKINRHFWISDCRFPIANLTAKPNRKLEIRNWKFVIHER